MDSLKEFIIICGYSKGNKDSVLNELKRVYSLTGKKVGVEKEYQLFIDTKKIHLEKLIVKELVTLLKNRYNCETKFYLVDEHYTEFDKVNDLLD